MDLSETPPTPQPLTEASALEESLPRDANISGSPLPPTIPENPSNGAISLATLIHGQDQEAAFKYFCNSILSVEKSDFGSSRDIVQLLLQQLLDSAPASFWRVDHDQALCTELFLRLREWIIVQIRLKETASESLVPPLELVKRLRPSDELLTRSKLVSPIKFLKNSSGAVGITAGEVAANYPQLFPVEETRAPSPPLKNSNKPKLFGLGGALKLNSHKRVREVNAKTDAEAPQAESASQRIKARKTVRWENEDKLVSIRYFEVEGVIKFKSKRPKKASLDAMERAPFHWVEPRIIEFSGVLDAQLISVTPIKRGGDKPPDDTEVTPNPDEASNEIVDFAEPPPHEQKGNPELARSCAPFKAASPHPEWVKKTGSGNSNTNVMNTLSTALNTLGAMNMNLNPMAMGMNPMGLSMSMNPMGMTMNMNMMNMNQLGVPGIPMGPMGMNMQGGPGMNNPSPPAFPWNVPGAANSSGGTQVNRMGTKSQNARSDEDSKS